MQDVIYLRVKMRHASLLVRIADGREDQKRKIGLLRANDKQFALPLLLFGASLFTLLSLLEILSRKRRTTSIEAGIVIMNAISTCLSALTSPSESVNEPLIK